MWSKLLRSLKATLLDDRENLLIDVSALAKLGCTKATQAHRVLGKIVFPFVEQAAFMEKRDRISVEAFVWVFPYPLDSGENQIRPKPKKPLHADVADLGCMASDPVMD